MHLAQGNTAYTSKRKSSDFSSFFKYLKAVERLLLPKIL